MHILRHFDIYSYYILIVHSLVEDKMEVNTSVMLWDNNEYAQTILLHYSARCIVVA